MNYFLELTSQYFYVKIDDFRGLHMIFVIYCSVFFSALKCFEGLPQQTFTCSKSAIKTEEKVPNACKVNNTSITPSLLLTFSLKGLHGKNKLKIFRPNLLSFLNLCENVVTNGKSLCFRINHIYRRQRIAS